MFVLRGGTEMDKRAVIAEDMLQGVELTVEMKGSRFNVYVNGIHVLDFEDSTYPSGYAGLAVWNTTAFYDDFRVWK